MAARRALLGKLGIGLLFALLVLGLFLHLRGIARTGLSQPPVFAVAAPSDRGYPRVGGFPLGVESDATGLRIGDRLLRAGDVDLRGAGYLGFMAIALEQAGREARVRVSFEREGVPGEVLLEMRRFAIPWLRVPFLLAGSLVGLALLLAARGNPAVRNAGLGLLGATIAECLFFGGPRWQTTLSQSIFIFGGGFGFALFMRWAILFPPEVAPGDRLSPHWAWMIVPLWLSARLQYLSAGPLPGELVPLGVAFTDACLVIAALGVLIRNHRRAPAIGRRRMRWLLYAFALPAAPMLVTFLGPLLDPRFALFEEMLAVSGLLGAIVPICVGVAATRYDALDVDRLIAATASYSLLLIAALATALAVVPQLGAAIARETGVPAITAQLGIVLSLAALAIPLNSRLSHRVGGLLFPGRQTVARGIEQLRRDLSQCTTPEDLFQLVRERLSVLFACEGGAVYTPGPGGFEDLQSPGAELPRFAIDDPVVRALAAQTGARPLGERIAIPMRSGAELSAFVVLGRKGSHDVYTPTDRSLLGTVAEATSAELRRIENAHTLRDARERVAELRELRDAAERANLAKSRFLAAASHDLRQPLQALGLFVQALAERVPRGEAGRMVEKIQASTTALSQMLDAMLDSARLDAGAVKPQVIDFPLAPLLERLRAEFSAAAATKGIAVRVVSSDAVVRSDSLLLARIVQNLVSNAVCYTKKGRVLVGCRRRGDRIRIDVLDTGPGIDRESHERIFQEFVQLEGGAAGGLGLGLSIVRRIARLLGHEVEFDSTPGRGSRFSLLLPRGRARGTDPRAPAGADPAPDFAGRLVAVVESDPAVREGLGEVLSGWGCGVILAASIDEAAGAVGRATRPPDVVLADYHLSGRETGLEAIRAVRRRAGVELPGVVLTGDTRLARLAEVRALGLIPLTKPVSGETLRSTLVRILLPS